MSYLPIVIEIKPDELLYSWFVRLANANSVRLQTFVNSYLDQRAIYIGDLLHDIRSEFVSLSEHIYGNPNLSELYINHATLRFDIMFLNERSEIKPVNRICLRTDTLNPIRPQSIKKIQICPKCIKDDTKRYGFPILHVSHHLSGVKACHIHNCILMEYSGSRGLECEYNLEDYREIAVDIPKKHCVLYSKYADELFKCGKHVNLEEIKSVFVNELNKKGYSLHKEGYDRFEKDFNNSDYAKLMEKDVRFCFTDYLIKKKAFKPEDFIPLLMFFFPDSADLISRLNDKGPVLIDSVCKSCGKSYMSYKNTEFTFNLCRNCYDKFPIDEKFKNMVRIIGNGEYKPVEKYESRLNRIRIRHACGLEKSYIPNSFLYGYSRCDCENISDKAWNKGYGILKEYYDEFGNSNIPKKIIYKGYKLGAYCQRLRKDQDRLSSDKLLLLQDLDFDFNPLRSAWEKNYKIYEKYVQDTNNRHVIVSEKYKGYNIGNWYADQRRKYKKGKLSEKQIDALRKIYPDFPKTPVKEKKIKEVKFHPQPFEDTVKLLLEYEKENGTLIVPKRFNYKGYNLGAWCQQMRSKRKMGKLTTKQIQTLDNLGFIWDVLGYKWQEDMDRYHDYVKDTGNYDVTREEIYKGFKMGYWYQNLKIARRKGTLTDEQRKDIIKINPNFFSSGNSARK